MIIDTVLHHVIVAFLLTYFGLSTKVFILIGYLLAMVINPTVAPNMSPGVLKK